MLEQVRKDSAMTNKQNTPGSHTLRELPSVSGENLVLPFVRRHRSKAKRRGHAYAFEGMGTVIRRYCGTPTVVSDVGFVTEPIRIVG